MTELLPILQFAGYIAAVVGGYFKLAGKVDGVHNTVKTQNGRIGKLEDGHNELRNDVANLKGQLGMPD